MSDFTLIGNQECRTEAFGDDLAFSRGTSVTSGVAHTKGAFVELIASTAFGYSGITIQCHNAATDYKDLILDIAIGAAASEEVIVKDFIIGSYGTRESNYSIYIPVGIPAGTRVAVRTQSENVSTISFIHGMGFSNSFISQSPVAKVTDYGVVIGSSKGTVVTSGSADVKGSYTELTSSTSEDLKGIFVFIGANNTFLSSQVDILVDIAVGAAASEVDILPSIGITAESLEIVGPGIRWFPINIPAGSRIAARVQTSLSTFLVDVAVYGGV